MELTRKLEKWKNKIKVGLRGTHKKIGKWEK
jgi:hypothetical protein